MALIITAWADKLCTDKVQTLASKRHKSILIFRGRAATTTTTAATTTCLVRLFLFAAVIGSSLAAHLEEVCFVSFLSRNWSQTLLQLRLAPLWVAFNLIRTLVERKKWEKVTVDSGRCIRRCIPVNGSV